MIVAFSRRALSDITAIFDDLLARASSRTARQMVDRIEQRCISLDMFPERGKRLEYYGFSNLRRVIEPPYVIVYAEAEDRVVIVAVLYQSRDIEAELLRLGA